MIIDIHFHMGGVENDNNIYISEEMASEGSFRALKAMLLLLKGEISNQAALEWSLKMVEQATFVDKVVALAFDWGYNEEGTIDRSRSHFWVSNDWVAEQVAQHPDRLLFGASVNPNRKDAIAELERVKKMGAVLVKLIPSSQGIDLAKERHQPFFARMAELDLPLLCHCGVEHTIPPFGSLDKDQARELNSTSKVEHALKAKTKVIVAHCGLPINIEDSLQDYLRLKDLFDEPLYKKTLYADLAAFLLPFSPYRKEVVIKAKNELDHSRLLLGSDFPMPPSPILGGYTSEMDLVEFIRLLAAASPLDRNALALRDIGFNKCVLHNADRMFGES